MNTSNPILVETKELIVPATIEGKIINIKAELKIQVFKEPIFKTGELVYNMATITHGKTTWGLAFYRDPMDEQELKDKISEIAENPTTIKAPFS